MFSENKREKDSPHVLLKNHKKTLKLIKIFHFFETILVFEKNRGKNDLFLLFFRAQFSKKKTSKNNDPKTTKKKCSTF